MSLKVDIVSPEKVLYSEEVNSVQVPGTKGRFEILVNHAPIISSLAEGSIVCRGKEEFTLDIKGGFLEMSANRVTSCVETEGK